MLRMKHKYESEKEKEKRRMEEYNNMQSSSSSDIDYDNYRLNMMVEGYYKDRDRTELKTDPKVEEDILNMNPWLKHKERFHV